MRKRKMSAAEAKINDEKKQEGREAFEKGMPVESCPYESAFDLKRWAWIWGWQEKARIKKAQEEADRAFLLEAERRGFVPKSPPPESKGLDLDERCVIAQVLLKDYDQQYANGKLEDFFSLAEGIQQAINLHRARRLRAGAEGGGRS